MARVECNSGKGPEMAGGGGGASMANGKSNTTGNPGDGDRPWPAWARRVVTAALLFHAAAILAGVWAANPSSRLEQGVDSWFERYDQWIRQGFSYRYYSPEPPPTPVVTATLAFADGRPEVVVRLPERGVRPRLRYQRQLALANNLMGDFEEARTFGGDGSKSRWARAFATHLGKAYPGCNSVTLRVQMHLIPNLERVRERLDGPGGGAVDLDADEFYTAPERIGVYPCDAS